MADPEYNPRRPNPIATLVHSPLWRSIHLAAPPLVPSLDAQQLAALAPADPREPAQLLTFYEVVVRAVADECAVITRHLHSPDAGLSQDDQAWLRTRLQALVSRLQASIPRNTAGIPVRDDVVRVAVGRMDARLRSHVEVHRNPPSQIFNFLTATLMEFKLQLRTRPSDDLYRPFDEHFLWHNVVALLYIDIDARAWYRYCHNKPWESLYYDDVRRHLGDMEADLERIHSRRRALQQQHSLAKPEFVPVARRNGIEF